MKFRRFASIDNSYRIKTIDDIHRERLDQGHWMPTEKVHGANFSLWTDGKIVRAAKRSGFLHEGEGFYGFEKVLERYKEPVLEAFARERKHKRARVQKELVFYGEIFGGRYPHPDVDSVKGVPTIQKGVWYTPDIDFYVFDVEKDGVLQEYFEAYAIAGETGHDRVGRFALSVADDPDPITFEEALEFDVENFKSIIHTYYGLPEIEDNFAEGVVIKPENPRHFGNGSRVILKKKHPKFSEKTKGDKVRLPAEPLSDDANFIFHSLMELVNENRLRNVLSKLGKMGQKDFGVIMQNFTHDALEELFLDKKEAFKALSKNEQKRITKQLGSEASNIIRPNFQNIIDGTY